MRHKGAQVKHNAEKLSFRRKGGRLCFRCWPPDRESGLALEFRHNHFPLACGKGDKGARVLTLSPPDPFHKWRIRWSFLKDKFHTSASHEADNMILANLSASGH